MKMAWKWKTSHSALFSKFLVISLVVLFVCPNTVESMSKDQKLKLKNEAREMFYHAYNSYMENAFPADELMPLSCKGRYRGIDTARGDIDDALGNFTLTLVDSLDTLVVLGDFDEFERAVKLVIDEVRFDSDVLVSVFETNIRMMGGLLSAHILSGFLQEKYPKRMQWYKGELLNMALDLGYRLLPAFNTTTGIPYSRVNLKTGVKSPRILHNKETCTACAGTMILEFAALSRLSGDPVFEEKAHKAMDALWSFRHRSSDLMGTVLNVHSGDWVRRDAGVGAGIDSYYEYCLKAYVLLGDERYLDRFNRHYSAVMKYISQGPLLLDVHMHRPHTNSKNFMDALLAFWPGLQVLKGDIKPAVETHEMLYQVIQRHNFLPEAFTTDFQVHWGQHPLRPEFVESSYFLYKATGDDYYLEAGAKVLNSLQTFARVPCGFAAVKDVRTSQHEDRMDSFVLAETFKYLYLLFSEPEDLPLTMDDFVLTTEAHLLPLSLARLSNLTAVPLQTEEQQKQMLEDEDVEQSRSCPTNHYLFPGQKGYAETIREPLKNMVERAQPPRKNIHRKLRALDFQAGNVEHMRLLRDMGITIIGLPDGRVQLLHSYSSAKTADDAEEGLLFMQEMVEISRSLSTQPENPPRSVAFRLAENNQLVVLKAGPAQFGAELVGDVSITAKAVVAEPYRMCADPVNPESLRQKIVIMERGDCMFIEKARRIQKSGAVAGIIIDNVASSSSEAAPLFAMSGDGKEDVKIAMVFLYSSDGVALLDAVKNNPDLEITMAESVPEEAEAGPSELRVDDSGAAVPLSNPDSTVEKLRTEVKRIVVEKMEEKSENLQKDEEKSLARGTYIIRMDESGAIVTEAVEEQPIENQQNSERNYLTLLRMALQFLISVQAEENLDENVQNVPGRVNLDQFSPAVQSLVEKIFRNNNRNYSSGIARTYVEELLASFRLLWPANYLPETYFNELEKVLMSLATDCVKLQPMGKQQNERLAEFLRNLRKEFSAQFSTKKRADDEL